MTGTDERRLGPSGISVSALGVGTWSWGDRRIWGYGGAYGKDDVERAYRMSLDRGVSFFDTAEGYGRGESERLLGGCRRADGRGVTLATKFAPLPTRPRARALLRALDESLSRLGVTQVDLYLVHLPSRLPTVESLMDVMAEAVKRGKVRAVGVSNYSEALMRRAHARLARHGIPLAANQVHYSLLHRNPERNGVLTACRELDVALIAASPLEQGMLSGKFRSGEVKPPALRRVSSRVARFGFDLAGDAGPRPSLVRRWHDSGQRATHERLAPLFDALEEVAATHEKTMAQTALNWLLSGDDCVIPIPGAKNETQAAENAGALGWRLSKVERDRLSAAAVR